MSRGGYRSGAGRPALHGKTHQYLWLDVNALHRRHLLKLGSSFWWTWSRDGSPIATVGVQVPDGSKVNLNYRRNGEPRYEAIDLRQSSCNLGGVRPWFVCPQCRRSVAIVYLGSMTGCRKCLRLRYQSQSEDFLDRSWRRTGRIMRKLGRDLGDFPSRPNGMRQRTYERLCSTYWDEERLRDEALALFMAEHQEC